MNNAWLESNESSWNALVQTIAIEPQAEYVLSAWIRTDLIEPSGRLGIRNPETKAALVETSFGPAPNYAEIMAQFNPGETRIIELYIALAGTRDTRYLEVDDVSLR